MGEPSHHRTAGLSNHRTLGNNEDLQAENTNATNSNLIVSSTNLIRARGKEPVEKPAGWA